MILDGVELGVCASRRDVSARSGSGASRRVRSRVARQLCASESLFKLCDVASVRA